MGSVGGGVSLLKQVNIPESHATIVGGMSEVEEAVGRGFKLIKLKAGREINEDAERINAVAERFSELKMRIDFNCHLLGSEVGELVELLTPQARANIDFLEDPCGYKDSCWLGLRKLYGIRLAMDIGVERVDALYSYAIVKPAKNNVKRVVEKSRAEARKVVFTSYMDHPVGQAFAAYEAGRAADRYRGIVDTCGLMTHNLFEPNAYTEELGEVSPEWSYQNGTGLGFDKLLESIDWKRLG